ILEDRLAPAIHIWSGADVANNPAWSNPGNWSVGGAPSANETDVQILFPAGLTGSALHSNNDITFAHPLSRIDFQGGDYELTGIGVQLNTALTSTSGHNLVQLPLTLAANQTWTCTRDAQTLGVTMNLIVAASVDLNGFTLTLDAEGEAVMGTTGTI